MATEQQVGSEAGGTRLSVFSVSPGELGGSLPTDVTWYEEMRRLNASAGKREQYVQQLGANCM